MQIDIGRDDDQRTTGRIGISHPAAFLDELLQALAALGLGQRLPVLFGLFAVSRTGHCRTSQLVEVQRIGFDFHIHLEHAAPGERPPEIPDASGQFKRRDSGTYLGIFQFDLIRRKAHIHSTQPVRKREIGRNDAPARSLHRTVRIPTAQHLAERPVDPHIDIRPGEIVLTGHRTATSLRSPVSEQRIPRNGGIDPLQRIEQQTTARRIEPTGRQRSAHIDMAAEQIVTLHSVSYIHHPGIVGKTEQRYGGIPGRRFDAESALDRMQPQRGRVGQGNFEITRPYPSGQRVDDRRVSSERCRVASDPGADFRSDQPQLVLPIDMHRIGHYDHAERLQAVEARRIVPSFFRTESQHASADHQRNGILRHIDPDVVHGHPTAQTDLTDMSHIQLTEPETGAGIDTQTAPNPDSSLRREQDGQRIEIDRPGHPRRYGRIAQRIPDRRIGIQRHAGSLHEQTSQYEPYRIGPGRTVEQRGVESQTVETGLGIPIPEIAPVGLQLDREIGQTAVGHTVAAPDIHIHIEGDVRFDSFQRRGKTFGYQTDQPGDRKRPNTTVQTRIDTVGRQVDPSVETHRNAARFERQPIE